MATKKRKLEKHDVLDHPSFAERQKNGKRLFTEKILFKIKPTIHPRTIVSEKKLIEHENLELIEMVWNVPPAPKGRKRFIDYFSGPIQKKEEAIKRV